MAKKVLSIMLAILLFAGAFVTPAFADVGDNEFTERESNNSEALADRIYNDYTVSGMISSKNDIDYFKFVLSKRSKVSFLCISDYSMILVGIADANGEIIAAASSTYDDGYYYDVYSATLAAGTYYIVMLEDQDYSYKNLTYLFYFEYESSSHTHSYSTRVVAPTCTEQGYTVYTCSCGYSYNGKYTSATGHKYGSWSTVTAATCTSTGTKKRTCKNCSYYQTETIPAIAHVAGSWIIDEAATCTTAGSKHNECTMCGTTMTVEAIPAAHAFSAWTVLSASTCSTAGVKQRTCTACGEVETSALPLKAHTPGAWIIDAAATCAAPGLKHANCTVCGNIAESVEIPALPHTTGDWIIDMEPTCSEVGLKHKDCSVCGNIAESVEIAKLPHTAGAWVIDTEATVYAAGSQHTDCTVCGETAETAEIPQLKCSKAKLKTIDNTTSGVKITWGKVKGADKYRVYRKTKSGDWKYLASTTKTGYTDKTAKSGTKYYYAIRVRNEAGNSSLSSSLSKYYLDNPTLKTPTSTSKGINLKWTKETGADGYMVYRKTGTGSYSRIATVKGVSKVSYTDKSAKKGKKYTYKVKAYKSKTYSAYSGTKTITDKY